MEVWMKINGYNNYSVSDLGRVRNDKTGRILQGAITAKGYVQVCLQGKMFLVHRLVADAFLGGLTNNLEVDHKNKKRSDNRLENLRKVTHQENLETRVCNTKTIAQYLIKDNHFYIVNIYGSIIEAAQQNHFSSSSICNCCRGKAKQAYGYVWQYYDFKYNLDNGEEKWKMN